MIGLFSALSAAFRVPHHHGERLLALDVIMIPFGLALALAAYASGHRLRRLTDDVAHRIEQA